MAEEFASDVVRRFTAEIASRLGKGKGKASTLARTAEIVSSESLTEQEFETLMDVEPPMFQKLCSTRLRS